MGFAARPQPQRSTLNAQRSTLDSTTTLWQVLLLSARGEAVYCGPTAELCTHLRKLSLMLSVIRPTPFGDFGDFGERHIPGSNTTADSAKHMQGSEPDQAHPAHPAHHAHYAEEEEAQPQPTRAQHYNDGTSPTDCQSSENPADMALDALTGQCTVGLDWKSLLSTVIFLTFTILCASLVLIGRRFGSPPTYVVPYHL